jgi:serine protease inhibitor
MKHIRFFFLLSFSVLLACSLLNPSSDEALPSTYKGPIKLTPAQQARVSQENAFALHLLQQTVAQTDESNVVLSPLSISVALGMARNGAAGETKTEMETALHLTGLTDTTINTYYKTLIEGLPVVDKHVEVALANAVWYKAGFLIKAPFLQTNTDYFNASLAALDFDSPDAVIIINDWCAEKTHDRITSIIDKIDSEVRMYLTNAVYFKGSWKRPFDPKQTVDGQFKTTATTQKVIKLMNLVDTFAYAADDKAQIVDLPYGEGDYAMTLMLPVNGLPVDDLLVGLTAESVSSMLASLRLQELSLTLPRFRTACTFEMKDPLSAMGMHRAFTWLADFSGISDIPLMISAVKHKTFLEVTEKGTEAAAVTAVEFANTAIPSYPSVVVDRPFLFLIREKGSGVILFAGKVADPEAF